MVASIALRIREGSFSETGGTKRAGAIRVPGVSYLLRSSSKEASMPPQCGTVQPQYKALYGTGAYESGFPLSPISKQISASSKVAAIT